MWLFSYFINQFFCKQSSTFWFNYNKKDSYKRKVKSTIKVQAHDNNEEEIGEPSSGDHNTFFHGLLDYYFSPKPTVPERPCPSLVS